MVMNIINNNEMDKKFHTKSKITGFDLIKKIAMWVIMIFFLLYTLLPILWLILSSLKTNLELTSSPFGLPAVPQFKNYINAFNVSGLGGLFFNSIFISICATLLNVLIACMASYVLSRFTFKFREQIFNLFVIGILVPINALMVPYFTLITKLHLYDTKFALIITYAAVGIPISVAIIRGFMKAIPMELDEASKIDGCNFFKRFFYIILPMSRTGIVTAATFEFLYCWNEFIYAMLLTSSPGTRTVQLGIRYFTNQFTTDYTGMYAAIVISIIPCIFGYIIFQEQIVSGLTNGAVKG